jgi:NAD dependent epimerase/dehydratase family
MRNTSPHYFNTAKTDPHGEIDETHTLETHLIPLAVEAAQDRNSVAEIVHTAYETKDGTAVRDFVHVWDLATARVKAVDCLIAGGTSGSLNLRSGRRHSIRGVSSAVETVSRGSLSYFAGAAHRHAHWHKRATYWPKLSRNGRSFAVISADLQFEPSLPGWRPLKSNLQARNAAPKRRHEPVGGDAHREGTRREQI